MTLEQMLDDLSRECNVGTKKNSKGYKESWIAYKLHIGAGDGQIPISCILTSASLHDSQAAIPLVHMTGRRVTNLYALSDPAYDAPLIHEQIRALGQVPIIDINPRRDAELKIEFAGRSEAAEAVEFRLRRGCALSRMHDSGTGKCASERRVRRALGAGARQRQSAILYSASLRWQQIKL